MSIATWQTFTSQLHNVCELPVALAIGVQAAREFNRCIDTRQYANVDQCGMVVAASNGMDGLVSCLLKLADVDPSDSQYYDIPASPRMSPYDKPTTLLDESLKNAVKGNHPEVVEQLLPLADPSVSDNYAIKYAVMKGYTIIVRLLLADSRTDPCVDDNLALRHALRYKQKEITQMLIKDDRFMAVAGGHEAMLSAIINDDLELLELLLSKKDVLRDGPIYITQASKSGNLRIVKRLLQYPEVNPAAGRNSALIAAISSNHIQIARLLLKDGRVNPSIDDNAVCIFGVNLVRRVVLDGRSEFLPMILYHCRFEAKNELMDELIRKLERKSTKGRLMADQLYAWKYRDVNGASGCTIT
jgi:Ankyrin repeats (3 copies)